MRRLSKVKIIWSAPFAYAIGIITTDGNLSPDKRHINITSKDKELIKNFKECLCLKNKIGRKSRGGSLTDKKYFVLQFGDVNFYDFLLNIGLMEAKSNKLRRLTIPVKYFRDFLRGCIDGDGNIDISIHRESKAPQLRLRLYSGSKLFISWLMDEIGKKINCSGGWVYSPPDKKFYYLCYGKKDSIKIMRFMYYDGVKYYLKRKHKLASTFLGRWRNGSRASFRN